MNLWETPIKIICGCKKTAMIKFEKTILKNGLTVIVNPDTSTPLVAMNILYKVGARDEDESKTGFAHLFEHLMFGGSVNIPSYDEPLQRAGGENNAFTNNDFTNYYLTIPAQNIETAFWLESDRMLSLAFSEKSLEVQRNVVIEEFKQRYFNQPYGDVWLNLRPLAYKVHPYKWATIGKEISHIENAVMDDVKKFFFNFYRPNNAILTLSGNINSKTAFELSERWFGGIEKGEIKKQTYKPEPKQSENRTATFKKDIPAPSVYKSFHACSRYDENFNATEMLADVLSGSKSSRLFTSLVKDKKIFNELHAYFLGDLDESLFVIEGKPNEGIDLHEANRMIDAELEIIKNDFVSDKELTKVKQKTESALVFSEMNIANRALNLSYFEMIGGADKINEQLEKYADVTKEKVQSVAQTIFSKTNESTLFYVAENKN